MEDRKVSYDDIFQEVNADDVNRFWTEKKVKAQCELCGADDWAVDGSQDEEVPIVPYHGRDAVDNFNTLMPLVFISCNNCGNSRIIKRSIILQWMMSESRRR